MTDPFASPQLAEAEEKLKSLGLPALKRPRDPKPLAEIDVEKLTNDQLGTYYAEHITWAVYLKGKVAQANIVATEAKTTLNSTTARLKRAARAERIPESQIAEYVHLDEDYVEAVNAQEQALAVKELLEVYTASHRAQAAALSRIISLRGIDLDSTRLGPGSARSKGRRHTRGVVAIEDESEPDDGL